jgi:hypothetical protein
MGEKTVEVPRLFVLVGPKEEELFSFSDGRAVFKLVQYPYRKTPDLYIVIKDSPVKCCQEDCGEEISIPKRGPSLASSRRITRHFLSHHRRRRTLLPWWDSDPNLIMTHVRHLVAKEGRDER